MSSRPFRFFLLAQDIMKTIMRRKSSPTAAAAPATIAFWLSDESCFDEESGNGGGAFPREGESSFFPERGGVGVDRESPSSSDEPPDLGGDLSPLPLPPSEGGESLSDGGGGDGILSGGGVDAPPLESEGGGGDVESGGGGDDDESGGGGAEDESGGGGDEDESGDGGDDDESEGGDGGDPSGAGEDISDNILSLYSASPPFSQVNDSWSIPTVLWTWNYHQPIKNKLHFNLSSIIFLF